MTEFIFCRVASIAEAISTEVGQHWGSGTYLSVNGNVYLLTNRHVAEKAMHTTLTHVVKNGETMAPLTEDFLTCQEADVALMPVNAGVWSQTDKLAVPFNEFGAGRPADGELLMVVGFPDQTSRFSALQKAVHSKAMRLITQRDPQLGDDGIHFWIKYRPSEIKTETGASADFIIPRGLSGSLVWNTGIVQSVRGGVEWSTDMLKPAGLVTAWNQDERALKVMRLDVVRQVVQKMVGVA